MISSSIYGVAVIDGSLCSRVYGTLPMHIITFVGGLLADSSPFLKFNSRLYVNKTVVLMQLFKMAWLCVAVRCALASHDNRLYFREHVDIVCGAARYMYSEKFWRMFE